MNKVLFLCCLFIWCVQGERFSHVPPREEFKNQFLECMEEKGGVPSLYKDTAWSLVYRRLSYPYGWGEDEMEDIVVEACAPYVSRMFHIRVNLFHCPPEVSHPP